MVPWTTEVPLHQAAGAYFRGLVGEAVSDCANVDTLGPTTVLWEPVYGHQVLSF